jgi:hypothetical protein
VRLRLRFTSLELFLDHGHSARQPAVGAPSSPEHIARRTACGATTLPSRTKPAAQLLSPSNAAVATRAEKGGARCRQARAGQGGSRGSRRSCRRTRELNREPARRLDHPGGRPLRRARWTSPCSPRHRMSIDYRDECSKLTWRATCLARPLGAGRCAGSRGREAEGSHGGRGSAVQPGLPVVSESSRWKRGVHGR